MSWCNIKDVADTVFVLCLLQFWYPFYPNKSCIATKKDKKISTIAHVYFKITIKPVKHILLRKALSVMLI